MKTIFFVTTILAGFFSTGQSLQEVRESFHLAVIDPEEARNFHALIGASQTSNATMHAYQAVSEAMLAQIIWNPLSKLSQVSKYNRMMEKVVATDAENIEIRFLRLAVEYNLPRFLGMSEHLETDRAFILGNLSRVSRLNLDPKFSAYILHFMKDASLISDEEIGQVEGRLLSLNQ